MNTNKAMVPKHILFPQEQIDFIDAQRMRFGTSFAEHIRRLVMISMMEEGGEKK